MRALLVIVVAAAVVIGIVPGGAAAAVASDASSPAAIGPAPGPAQTADNGTATATPSSNTTDEGATTATNTTDGNETGTTDGNETDANGSITEPGAQLAGVVGVQAAEVESEVSSRAFGQRVAAAASNDSKAAIVASEVTDSRERLDALRDRLTALEAARDAGEISEGRYRAETARVSAEINAVERRLDESNDTASSLPASVREANGLNTSNIDRLRAEARNLSGPEVAAIARSIGGDRSGRGLGDNVGPPGRSGNASGPSGPPAGGGGPPGADREENRSNGNGPPSDRGPGNESDADRGNGAERGNGSDRGNDSDRGNGENGTNPQESEANRNENADGDDSDRGAGEDDAGGSGSNSERGGGNDNDRGGNGDSNGGSSGNGGSNEGSSGNGGGNSNGNAADILPRLKPWGSPTGG